MGVSCEHVSSGISVEGMARAQLQWVTFSLDASCALESKIKIHNLMHNNYLFHVRLVDSLCRDGSYIAHWTLNNSYITNVCCSYKSL